MDVTRVKLPGGVAKILGVSPRMARDLARKDPQFPSVIVLGPRTRMVEEPALRAYIEAKRVTGAGKKIA